MLGDSFEMYQRGVLNRINKGENPFEHCRHRLTQSDLNVGNLECTISDVTNRRPPYSDLFRIPTKYAYLLQENRIHVVNLANNHTRAHGSTALRDMIKVLKSAGIQSFGFSEGSMFQVEPLVIRKKGVDLGFLGYNLANMSETEMSMTVGKIIHVLHSVRNNIDFLILSLHWGYEYSKVPPSYIVRYGKMFLNNGADVLYGHHSHVLQGIEQYLGKIFAPSLGNFVFDAPYTKCRSTAILQIECNTVDHSSKYYVHPYWINDHFQPVEKPELNDEIERLNRMLSTLIQAPDNVLRDYTEQANQQRLWGHLRNRIYIRWAFISHIHLYYPHIMKIFGEKILRHTDLE